VSGASAAGINIDRVRYVDWRNDPRFADADVRHAAELVAFDVLEPTLRSRGAPRQTALANYKDPALKAENSGRPCSGRSSTTVPAFPKSRATK
jgi:hypothetical protein